MGFDPDRVFFYFFEVVETTFSAMPNLDMSDLCFPKWFLYFISCDCLCVVIYSRLGVPCFIILCLF